MKGRNKQEKGTKDKQNKGCSHTHWRWMAVKGSLGLKTNARFNNSHCHNSEGSMVLGRFVQMRHTLWIWLVNCWCFCAGKSHVVPLRGCEALGTQQSHRFVNLACRLVCKQPNTWKQQASKQFCASECSVWPQMAAPCWGRLVSLRHLWAPH